MNNILDENNKSNHRFLCCVIAALCSKQGSVTAKLEDVQIFWEGEVSRIQYDLVYDLDKKTGTITFSLKEKHEN